MAIDPDGGPPPSTLTTDAEREDVREVADILARKWHLEVLTQLQQDGPYRFNELKRQLGVTPKVLTDCLRELTEEGLVDRTVYSESPPHVEYGLAEQGYELQQIAAEMAAWTSDPDTAPTVLVVDTAVSTNVRFSKWLTDGYTVERISDTAHVDRECLERADVVLYHHPILDERSDLVERLQDESLDVGVVHVTVHRRSLTGTERRAVELVDPVLKDELLQAVQTVLPAGEASEQY
jgi:DNA-binding HxlR family transcriptional regulator